MMSNPEVQNLASQMGGGPGAPDLSRMMQDPMMQQMAQNLMQDPAAMQNMMGMMQGMMGGGGDGGGMAGLLNNPMMQQMANNIANQNPGLAEHLQREYQGGSGD